MNDNHAPEGCTHNCHTCGESCSTEKGESFFDKLENISEVFDGIDEAEVLKILNDTVSEWEKEMEEDDTASEAKEAE